MFNDKYGLTKAVLEGLKTQTRRIINAPAGEELEPHYHNRNLTSVHSTSNPNFILNPAYRVGEEVAVAQSYNDTWKHTGYMSELEAKHCPGYNNKMFVRADLMPHRIKITNVRVEHLQDISVEDCLKEGLQWLHGIYYVNYNKETGSRMNLGNDYKKAFAALIDKTCGRGTWHSNPYVFVYDFILIK